MGVQVVSNHILAILKCSQQGTECCRVVSEAKVAANLVEGEDGCVEKDEADS